MNSARAGRQTAGGEPHNFDLGQLPLRELNQALHNLGRDTNATRWRVQNPGGRHAIAVGLNAPVAVEVEGHAGYYCGGMNQLATIIVHGNAGVGVAENMMSGFVHVKGDASQSAGASAHGGVLLIDGNASARCGISLKGADIIVRGSVGHMSAFMAQAGSLIVFGDAGENLGDSIYEAKLFVAGKVASLGSDCIEKKMTEEARNELYSKLKAAGMTGAIDVSKFRRYGSARKLYHFHVDHAGAY
jgi:methylamine---glutamate N-methyltransferase subunit B